jgi:hypothetical protein
MSFYVSFEAVMERVRAGMPHGTTQIEVFTALIQGQDPSTEEIGRAMQATSRFLSQAAAEGYLDDTTFVGLKRLYKIPPQKLAARGTKTERLEAEVAQLKQKLKDMTEARNFMVDKYERLEDKLREKGLFNGLLG